ncbi:Mo-co oxidoreductase dimerisation domain-containing protein [Jannaschia faecimaris]|uniref:Mo-co oxidoreductase dimerisation domain-containing protein n=1 Tax=Jannaschia faecimaris TaxID=1244108 RepID=A0A1H3NJS5_9RHOB|nr:molybdopterin-dependent oxidoreductase [Jannaschia faecimaris]SDY89054.1 Mo-co oxidoreductase dimerisation domain-containing protein [Jannaschia faecimaris]
MAVRMDPPTTTLSIPMQPADMLDQITPVSQMISLSHLGVPQIQRSNWRLKIDGLVERAAELTFDDIAAYPKHRIVAAHQCAGSPLNPQVPTQRVCNMVWSGARLADILADCGPCLDARFVWATGADHGSFAGVDVENFQKDLPISRVEEDVLLAYELNDAPLPDFAGFPVRLFVPGYYGTNSVKWLTHLHLATDRADGPFTSRWYNDPMPDGPARPVWAIAPASCIVTSSGQKPSGPQEVWGWAWGDRGIDRVEVSTDGGTSWHTAVLEPAEDRGWQRFSLEWSPSKGAALLMSRAYSRTGDVQPASGARNAIFSVAVTVT